MTSADVRRLVVVRHAKSAWPDVADSTRPLAPRGHSPRAAAGRWLREADCVPDLVVCSSALRARQTWDLVAAELGVTVPLIHETHLYQVGVGELLGVVRGSPRRYGR